MRDKRSHIARAASLALVICFATQVMLIPGVHRHPADCHGPEPGLPGYLDLAGFGADEDGYRTHSINRASSEPASRDDASRCPICIFLKNLKGPGGIDKIPVPILAPDSHALPRKTLIHAFCSVASLLPRGPPTT
jgi:hypothetical protein